MPTVHCKKAPYDVYIGRPSKWGNPYSHKQGTKARYLVASRDEAIKAYKRHLWDQINSGAINLEELAALSGKTLGCWCHPKPCHGEVILAAADWAHDQLVGEYEQQQDQKTEQYIADHYNEAGVPFE